MPRLGLRHTGSEIINIFCHHNTEAVSGVILISIQTQCSLSRVRDRKAGKSHLCFRTFYGSEYQDEYHLGGIILLSGVKSGSGQLGFFVTPRARTVDISSKWGTKRGNVIL